MRAIVLAPAAAVVMLLSGCASTIEAAELESEIRNQYPEATSVSCPDLKGKKGEKAVCDVAFGDFETKAEAEVELVTKRLVNYSIALRDEPPAKG